MWFIQAKCVTRKAKPPEKNGLTFHIELLFKRFRESQRENTSTVLDYCSAVSGVTEFRQAEKKASKDVLRK